MRGWTAALALTCAALAPAQANALSCLEYSVAAAYWSYQDSPKTYVLVLGSFSDLRRVSVDHEADQEKWSGKVAGHTASMAAFDQPFEADVTLYLSDYSDMMGAPSDEPPDLAPMAADLAGQTGLMWLERTVEGFRTGNMLCWPFLDTDPASVRPALDCIAKRSCPRP